MKKYLYAFMFMILATMFVKAEEPVKAPSAPSDIVSLIADFYVRDFQAASKSTDTIEKSKDYAVGAAKIAATIAVIKMLNDNKFDPVDFYTRDFREFNANPDVFASTASLVKGTAKVVGTVIAVETLLKIAKDKKEADKLGKPYVPADSGITKSDLDAAVKLLEDIKAKAAASEGPAKK